MAVINVTGEAKLQILADIFGDRRSKEKGLIDCEPSDEFDAKLLFLKGHWDEVEKSLHIVNSLCFIAISCSILPQI